MCNKPAGFVVGTKSEVNVSSRVSSFQTVRLDRLRFEVQGSPRVVVKIKDVNFVQTTFMVGNKSSDFELQNVSEKIMTHAKSQWHQC